MFHELPPAVEKRMRYLEEIDARDRHDGTDRLARLRQVPPETGRFLALMAAAAPDGRLLEIGTSAGYSTMWIALAAAARGARVITFELLAEKVALAHETFRAAELEHVVELVADDARPHLPALDDVAFCFLDAEKEVYSASYEAVVPNLVSGGLLLADNAINHRATLQPFLDHALADRRVDALIVPIGKGVLLARKV